MYRASIHVHMFIKVNVFTYFIKKVYHPMYFVILYLGCGGTQAGSGGTVTSPGYPRYYQDNLICTWTLTAPTRYSVKAEIIDFHTESSYDYLKVVFTKINYIYTYVNIFIFCVFGQGKNHIFSH